MDKFIQQPDARQLDLFDRINDITDEQAEERKKECE
jgi:hypothetical protein